MGRDDEPLFRYDKRGRYPGYRLNPDNPNGCLLTVLILVGIVVFWIYASR